VSPALLGSLSFACGGDPGSSTAQVAQGGSDFPASAATHHAIGVARWHESESAFTGYDDRNAEVVSFVAASKNVAADTVNVTANLRVHEDTSSYAFTAVEDQPGGIANTTFTQRDEPNPAASQQTLTLFLADSTRQGVTPAGASSLSPSSLQPTGLLTDVSCTLITYNYNVDDSTMSTTPSTIKVNRLRWVLDVLGNFGDGDGCTEFQYNTIGNPGGPGSAG
jgi:hypothetical protein